MTSIAVALEGVSRSYDATVALHPLDLTIEEGSFVVILGPSGSGKTTLLSIIGGFVPPSSGRVVIAGRDVTALPPARRPTATVFQDYALFPHMTVEANVAFGLRMRGVPPSERLQRAQQTLDLVGLNGFGPRRVHQLSGGQQQRVALARAVAVEPAVLLLDEPLGALDLGLRRQMQEELKAIQRRLGATFVHVTHDQEEAMTMADRIILMNQGRIEDSGTPERVYRRPSTAFSARFMGESNVLEGRVKESAGNMMAMEILSARLSVQGNASAGEIVSMSIRPENLLLAPPAGASVELGVATVVESVFRGTHHRLRAALGPETVVIHVPQETTYRPGDRIPVFARIDDIVPLATSR